jgi:nucleotide-binding universal stress UspA family protein
LKPAQHPYLLCYDASEDARAAIGQAPAITGGGPALVVHVWRPPSTFTIPGRMIEEPHPLAAAAAEFDASAAEEAERIAAEGVDLARQAGFDASPMATKGGRGTWPAIVKIAEEREARAVVIGAGGRSAIRDVLLGSVASGLVNHCERPVLVFRVPRHEGASERQED